MRRWLVAWSVTALLASALAAACNTITGLDDISGTECTTAAECPRAGECTAVVCSESGLCTYQIAFEAACSGGACDEGGVCVECVKDVHCEKNPAGPTCNVLTHRCITPECGGDEDCITSGEVCHNGECVQCWNDDPPLKCDNDEICSPLDGRCVQCDTAPNCNNQKLPGPECWKFVCVDRTCVPTPDKAASCMGGIGTCQADATCSPVPP